MQLICVEQGPSFYGNGFNSTNCSDLATGTELYSTIQSLYEKTPAYLLKDLARRVMYLNNELNQDFSNLYFPLMCMWYFIAGTMFFLVIAGILILEKPSLSSQANPKNIEINNSKSKIDAINSIEIENDQPLIEGQDNQAEEDAEHTPLENDTRYLIESTNVLLPDTQEDISTSEVNRATGHGSKSKLNDFITSISTQLSLPKDYEYEGQTSMRLRKNSEMIGKITEAETCATDNIFESDTKNLMEKETEAEKTGLFSIVLIKQISFCCHLLSSLLFFAGYFCILPYLDGLLGFFGMPEVERPDFILIMGFVELASRLWHAFYLVDRFNKMKLISLTYIGDGLGLMICLLGYITVLQPHWKVFMILSFVIGGYFNAGFGGLVMAVLVELIDPEYFSIAVGMQSIFIGIGESLGPLIGGFMNDQFGGGLGYLAAVAVGGCLMVASGLVAGVMHFVFQREMRLKREKLEAEAKSENQA